MKAHLNIAEKFNCQEKMIIFLSVGYVLETQVNTSIHLTSEISRLGREVCGWSRESDGCAVEAQDLQKPSWSTHTNLCQNKTFPQ